ncbi:MAG: type 1 glutamine amidotransferase [Acidimicrobiales bacterium]
MIVFVDYEHPEGHDTEWGPKLLAARTTITYRLEDLAEQHCMLVRYDRITPELMAQLEVEAVFISGNGTDPDRYDPTSLEPLTEVGTSGRVPVFGFCGGFQFIAQALGATLAPINADVGQEHGELLRPFSNGRLGEMGYHKVDILGDHPLVDGLGPEPVFRHAHHLEVPEPPPGFEILASSPITAVQMAVDNDRRLVGTQFHPEYYTDRFPDGERLIRNFLRWAGIGPD